MKPGIVPRIRTVGMNDGRRAPRSDNVADSENCIASAPSVFRLDGEGKAVLLDPSTVDAEALVLVAEICPTEAIILEDEDGNQVFP
jgi:ferredoxin